MAEKPRTQRPKSDIDISTRAAQPKLGWRGNFLIWGGVLTLFALFYYFELSYWTMLLIVPLLILAVIAWFVWVAIYKRGAFTWMRLAMKPAKLMGIESNSMVLAGSPDGGKPTLVGFDQELPPGARVR